MASRKNNKTKPTAKKTNPNENTKADTVDKMNSCLGTYYESLGNKTYYNDDHPKGIFTEFCDENGYEDEDMKEEIRENDPENFVFTEIDNNGFPFPNDVQNTKANILKEFVFCYNNGYPSTNIQTTEKAPKKYSEKRPEPPTIDDYDFKDDEKAEMKIARELYGKEDIVSYAAKNNKNKGDETMLKLLAMGVKNNDKTFVVNLAMAYVRDKIYFYIQQKKSNNSNPKQLLFEVKHWIKTKSVLKEKLNNKQIDDLTLVINAYTGRICPPLSILEMKKINDSITHTALRILIASHFVQTMMPDPKFSKHSKLPFQIDFVIAVDSGDSNSAIIPTGFEDDFEDDTDTEPDSDDDDDKKEPSFAFEDIVKKFDGNKLLHSKGIIPQKNMQELLEMYADYDDDDEKAMNMALNQKSKRLALCYAEYRALACHPKSKYAELKDTYPRHKRFGVFITESDEGDSIAIYDPPDKSNSLPEPAKLIAESFFNLSKKCIIPKNKNERRHINVNDAHGGKLLTVSYQVVQKDEIRCYLYWNGKCMRFYPKDIVHVLPYCFNMKSDMNKNTNMDVLRRIAKSVPIEDYRFEAFYKSLDKNSKSLSKF